MAIWHRPDDDEIIIAHISDPHFGSAGQQNCWDVISQFLKNEVRPKLLVVTGDLADSPSRDLYNRAKNALDSLGFDYHVCAGNHDRHLKGNVSRRLSSLLGRRDTQALFDQTFVDQVVTRSRMVTKVLTEGQTTVRVGFLGVDSSLLADYFARGYVAAVDFAPLRKVIEKEGGNQDFVILLVHHHLQPVRKLEESHRNTPSSLVNVTSMINSGSFLENLAIAGVDLALHGHEHTSHWAKYGSLEGGHGEVAVIGAGSATGNDSLEGCSLDRVSFNLIILSADLSADLQVLKFDGSQWRSEGVQIFDSRAGKRLRLLRRARNLTSGLSSRFTKYVEFTAGRDVIVHFVFTDWYFPEERFEDGVTSSTGWPENPSVRITNASGRSMQIPVVFKPHSRQEHTWKVWGNIPEDFSKGPVRYEFSYTLRNAGLLTSADMKTNRTSGAPGVLREEGLEFASVNPTNLPLESAQLIIVLPPEFAPEGGAQVRVYDDDDEIRTQEGQILQRSVLRLGRSVFSLTVPYPRENWFYALAWSPVDAPVTERAALTLQESSIAIPPEIPEPSSDKDSLTPYRGVPFAQRPLASGADKGEVPSAENAKSG